MIILDVCFLTRIHLSLCCLRNALSSAIHPLLWKDCYFVVGTMGELVVFVISTLYSFSR
jgi:hypothetical protein